MSKKQKISSVALILSFSYALYLSIFSDTLLEVTILTTLYWAFFFTIFIFTRNAIVKIIHKEHGKAVLHILLILVISYSIWFAAILMYSHFTSGLCFPAEQHPYLQTNIVTGECYCGGATNCITEKPWYIKVGCNISPSEQQKLIEKSNESPFHPFGKCTLKP